MSASREKQARKNTGAAPKTAREARQRQEERRGNLIYGAIGVALAVAIAASVLWNSNIISRTATAAVIDGEKYSAAQLSFYYHNAYLSVVNNWSYLLSYIGLDTSVPLENQTVSETAANFLDIEEGITWKECFLQRATEQMASIQNGLKEAEAENFAYPDSVQERLEESMDSLAASARASGVSVARYLQGIINATMTERVYRNEMERTLQYQAYTTARENALDYTEEEIQDAYDEDPDSFDLVSYELATLDATAPSTTDEEGNTVEPTEEDNEAAHDAAEVAAEKLLAAYQADEEDSVTSAGNVTSSGDAADSSGSVTSDGSATADSSGSATADSSGSATSSGDAADSGGTVTSDGSAADSGEDDTEDDTESRLKALSADISTASYTEREDVSYSSISYNEVLSDWLFDSDREAGDAAALEGESDFYVVVFRDRYRDESPTVDVRHILISPEEGELDEDAEGYEEEQDALNAAAKERAEEILAEWEAGAATEESFAALADEYSDDSGSVGGLYRRVSDDGSMVQSFVDWSLDPDREPGDTGIIDSTYGYHIMYFVGEDLPKWEADVFESLKDEDYQDWIKSLYEESDITREGFGLRFVT